MELGPEEISRALVEKAVGEGFEEAIALAHRRSSAMAKVFNSEVSVVQRWQTVSVDLYMAKGRRVFVLSLEPDSLEEVNRSIKELASIADRVAESSLYAPIPRVEKVEPLRLLDKALVEHMDRVDLLVERLVEASHRERIDSVAGAISICYEERAIATSTSASALELKAWLTGYVRAFAGDGSGQWSFTSTKLDLRGLEEAALTASRYAIDSRSRDNVEPGIYDVILSPMAFGNLSNYIMEMASAFSVLSGASIFMARSTGDRVASERLSIYDAPRDEVLPSSTGFDDEALSTYNKPVVENGILKTFLHNTKTANAMKARSTANAGWIAPRPWNIVVGGGDSSLDEMISEVRRGLLITNNWYTRLQNYVEGLFSTIARDAVFLIEGGRIARAVGRIRISDTFTNVLNGIDMLGRDLYNVHWWEVGIPTRSPFVLVRGVRTSKHFA